MTKDLINRLRNILGARSEHVDLAHEAADALDRLTGGDVELPEPQGKIGYEAGRWEYEWISSEDGYTESQLREYGDRRAAAMVMQPLTDEQITEIRDRYHRLMAPFEFARAIEAAHGIGKGEGV